MSSPKSTQNSPPIFVKMNKLPLQQPGSSRKHSEMVTSRVMAIHLPSGFYVGWPRWLYGVWRVSEESLSNPHKWRWRMTSSE
jgi:hypothetical protein